MDYNDIKKEFTTLLEKLDKITLKINYGKISLKKPDTKYKTIIAYWWR